MGSPELAFLAHLAVKQRVSASTQNQALCALLFLYRDVLKIDDLTVELSHRAQRPARLPVVLTKQEVRTVLDRISGPGRLVAGLLYGAGLRLMECLTLEGKGPGFHAKRDRDSGRERPERSDHNASGGGEGAADAPSRAGKESS